MSCSTRWCTRRAAISTGMRSPATRARAEVRSPVQCDRRFGGGFGEGEGPGRQARLRLVAVERTPAGLLRRERSTRQGVPVPRQPPKILQAPRATSPQTGGGSGGDNRALRDDRGDHRGVVLRHPVPPDAHGWVRTNRRSADRTECASRCRSRAPARARSRYWPRCSPGSRCRGRPNNRDCCHKYL